MDLRRVHAVAAVVIALALSIGWLVAKGVPANVARPNLIGAFFLLIIAALGVTKCAYDKRIIDTHEAKQEAATAKADRKADAKAAEEGRADDARAVAITGNQGGDQ